MMMPSIRSVLLLASAAVGCLLAVALIRTHRRIVRPWQCLDETGIERGLALLLKRGYDGGYGIFTDKQTARFIQFRKYIVNRGEIGLEMHFPRAPWSERFYREVPPLLNRLGIPYSRVPLATDPVVEVIQADFGADIVAASRFAADVATEVFGMTTVCLDFVANDICPLDELVDDRAHPRAPELAKRLIRQRFSFKPADRL